MLDKIKVRGPDGYVAQERSSLMNTLWIVVIATVVIYLAYNFYARRIDRDIIKADARKATPATMYMDGVDFMPTSKNVLYGYHFKSIAAAGPITGPILCLLYTSPSPRD